MKLCFHSSLIYDLTLLWTIVRGVVDMIVW